MARRHRVTADEPRAGDYDYRPSLVAKLHPRRFSGMSPQMAAVVGYVVDERYTDPWIAFASVTSDGYVVATPASGGGFHHDVFLGAFDDVLRNVRALVTAAGLLPEEEALLRDAFYARFGVSLGREGTGPGRGARGASPGERPSGQRAEKLRDRLAKLRQMRTDRGCSAEEADAARRLAEEIERKLAGAD